MTLLACKAFRPRCSLPQPDFMTKNNLSARSHTLVSTRHTLECLLQMLLVSFFSCLEYLNFKIVEPLGLDKI